MIEWLLVISLSTGTLVLPTQPIAFESKLECTRMAELYNVTLKAQNAEAICTSLYRITRR